MNKESITKMQNGEVKDHEKVEASHACDNYAKCRVIITPHACDINSVITTLNVV